MKDYIKIAEAHIEAEKNNTFTNPHVTTRKQAIEAMLRGETFSEALRQVEVRYVSITSLLTKAQFGHMTEAYKRGVRKGFRELLKQTK